MEHFQKVINKILARNTKPKPEYSKGCGKHCNNYLPINKEEQAREIPQINLRRKFQEHQTPDRHGEVWLNQNLTAK